MGVQRSGCGQLRSISPANFDIIALEQFHNPRGRAGTKFGCPLPAVRTFCGESRQCLSRVDGFKIALSSIPFGRGI